MCDSIWTTLCQEQRLKEGSALHIGALVRLALVGSLRGNETDVTFPRAGVEVIPIRQDQ